MIFDFGLDIPSVASTALQQCAQLRSWVFEKVGSRTAYSCLMVFDQSHMETVVMGRRVWLGAALWQAAYDAASAGGHCTR